MRKRPFLSVPTPTEVILNRSSTSCQHGWALLSGSDCRMGKSMPEYPCVLAKKGVPKYPECLKETTMKHHHPIAVG